MDIFALVPILEGSRQTRLRPKARDMARFYLKLSNWRNMPDTCAYRTPKAIPGHLKPSLATPDC